MISKCVEDTINYGEKLGSLLKKGDCVVLEGELAGGKTTFTKGIGKALGVKSIINSPTFNILKIHKGNIDLYHIDAYRLEGNDYDLGFDEFLSEGVMVIEWPQYYEDYLPDAFLIFTFDLLGDSSRIITVSQKGHSFDWIVEEMSC